MKLIDQIQSFLEELDHWRDRVLFIFIKPYWPRFITPNHLTFLRIVISLVLFVLLFYYQKDQGALIISLFFIGAFTDMLDGSIARGLNKITKWGEFWDPVADRLLLVPIAVYSLINDHPLLLMCFVVFEFINSLMSVYGQGQQVAVASNIFGKVKMVLQSVVFGVIIIFFPAPPHLIFIYALWISIVLLIISIYVKYAEIRTLLYAKK